MLVSYPDLSRLSGFSYSYTVRSGHGISLTPFFTSVSGYLADYQLRKLGCEVAGGGGGGEYTLLQRVHFPKVDNLILVSMPFLVMLRACIIGLKILYHSPSSESIR